MTEKSCERYKNQPDSTPDGFISRICSGIGLRSEASGDDGQPVSNRTRPLLGDPNSRLRRNLMTNPMREPVTGVPAQPWWDRLQQQRTACRV